MNIPFASKGILCAVGFIALGAASVSVFAQSAEYRRGYDQGYRDGIEAQSREDEQGGPGPRIHIEEAQYGVRDASCDIRDLVQQAVGRRSSFPIVANNELCGDPAPNVRKRLRITYRCGDGEALTVRAPDRKSVV